MEGCKGFRPGSAVLAEAAPECQRSPFAQKGGEIPWSEWSQSTAVQGPHLCPWLAWVCRVKMLGTRATSGKASTADRAICRFDCFAHARERLQRLLRVRMEQGPTGCTRFVHRYSNNIRTRLPGIWSGGAAVAQRNEMHLRARRSGCFGLDPGAVSLAFSGLLACTCGEGPAGEISPAAYRSLSPQACLASPINGT